MDTDKEARRREAQDLIDLIGPVRRSEWEHYKGGLYVVICCAISEADLVPVVVYRSLTYNHVWTRPLSQWHETVPGQDAPRFKLYAPGAANHEPLT